MFYFGLFLVNKDFLRFFKISFQNAFKLVCLILQGKANEGRWEFSAASISRDSVIVNITPFVLF